MSDRMTTRSGLKLEVVPKKAKSVPRKRRKSESDEEEEVSHLSGENVFERLESLLEKTNNFAQPISYADILAVHGDRAQRKSKKISKMDALNMVAKGYDRTATFYDKTPKFIEGEMRDYQIEGLNWMISLQKAGLNGVLADEMGLGKTLQTISLLAHNKIVEKCTAPSLVIAPLPTILNWAAEIERFCPKLKAIVLTGQFAERRTKFNKALKAQNFDVCVISYETACKLQTQFRRVHFNYVVIDEAQRIKNHEVSLAKAVRTFHTQRRLLLTGTPFQNNITELWALLYFLVPAIFDDIEDFAECFSSQNLSDDVNLVNRLHRILNPFMLRRVKQDVEKSILPKKEFKIYMGLTELQKKWYRKVLNKEIEIMNRDGVRLGKKIEHVLMALREVANHPYMLPAAEPVGPPFVTDETIVTSSGKMMVLDKMLEKFQAEGSRVLIFSQFTMMLDILEDYALWKKIKYSRFDGNTDNEERNEKVLEFNSEGSETFMFLMSTRAGGLGINLASADVVVLYDSDWNPQMDFQAIARAHRIGQKKQVRVFRLITEGTVDDYIMRTNEHKVRLGGVIIQDKQMLMEARKTKKDLLEVLNAEENRLSTGDLESIGEIDLEKMMSDAEKLAERETEEKRQKLAEDNRYLVHDKGDHEIWEYSGQNHWIDRSKMYQDPTVEERLRKNPKKTSTDDHALTVEEFWNRLGFHISPHDQKVWNYRFYPVRYVELCQKKFDYFNGQNQILYLNTSEKMTKGNKKDPPLTTEESAELNELAAERACSWSFNRFSVYVKNLASIDAFDHTALARSITCEDDEVIKFSDVLWKRIDELPNKEQILANVEEYKKECAHNKKMTEMIGKKRDHYDNPDTDMVFDYTLVDWDEPFQHHPLEDRFIVNYMFQKGYNTSSLGQLMSAGRLQPRSFKWPCLKAGSGVVRKRLTYLMEVIKGELRKPVKLEVSAAPQDFDPQVPVHTVPQLKLEPIETD